MCKTQLRRYLKLPPRAVLAPGLGPSAEKGWDSPIGLDNWGKPWDFMLNNHGLMRFNRIERDLPSGKSTV